MRRLLVLAAVAVLAPAAPAAATTLPSPFTAPCPTYGDARICSGSVPSFDGAKLDADLTLPAPGTGATHPLIVMLHGFGNNKHEWESLNDEADNADKYRWNNHWFAKQGYYVLNYTARGFRDDGPTADYQPPTPADQTGSVSAPDGTIKVKSRDFEIRDTQWLAALTAATHPDVDPHRVAVTGGSYGGGESWVQASQAQWTFPHAKDPTLPTLELQVAVPKYPWTDLAYSLAANGHGGGPSRHDIYESSQAEPESDTGGGSPQTGNPIGVPKASYIAGLFASGNLKGVFDPEISSWNARLLGAGDPYPDADPVLRSAARGLTELRSAYYQDTQWKAQLGRREVAVFSISGWTDDLFEAVESFRQFKYLKRLDPQWPVSVSLGDVGHSRAQNKPATWQRINADAFRFLQANIAGSRRGATTVTSEQTTCDGATGPVVTATTPEGLARGAFVVTYGGGTHTLTNPPSGIDPNGPAADPIASSGTCRTSPGPATGGYTGVSTPLRTAATYVGLGEVVVPYTVTPALGQAQLDARIWDVPPAGAPQLVTRGTYRIDTLNGYDAATGTLRLPLYGNHWRFAAGHSVRLDLTQVDAPTLRPNNQPSAIAYGTPRLLLPTREERFDALSGTP
jgi:dienelactone hydrolase